MEAVDPNRQKVIRSLNQVPGATEKLVFMRKELLRLKESDSDLDPLDLDFQHLFAAWFNRGFLVMRPITWETPAHILEKIIAYEAVHAIDRWSDLRRRLQPGDRRCFAFFHLSMPDEPLIFVEVALMDKTPSSIDSVLTDEREELDPTEATTAVFYSISNCQRGLAKISFGNFLIKQVANDLAAELPNLTKFITLSPIPRLVSWMKSEKLPYEEFHLGNGAAVHAIHLNADRSENGLKQSRGLMVNYQYVLDSVSSNHERYAHEHFIIAEEELHKLAAPVKNQLKLRK